MQKNKIKILLSIGILIAGFGFYYSVEAAAPSIYVSPATLSKNVGETFNLSVGVNTGQKVCAVEGKLNLDKLSCQSVNLGDGVMAQSSPTCNNLYFLLGIPGCTTSDKNLFTVTVKAESAGTATANFSGVDIIGEGVSISSTSLGGSYTLITPTVKEEITPPKEEIIPPVEEEKITPPKEEEITPPEEEVALPEKEVVVIPPEEKVPEEGLPSTFLAAIGNILTLGTGNVGIGIVVLIIILTALIYIIYYFARRSRRKKLGNIQ